MNIKKLTFFVIVIFILAVYLRVIRINVYNTTTVQCEYLESGTLCQNRLGEAWEVVQLTNGTLQGERITE